jgi:hypothetical protein
MTIPRDGTAPRAIPLTLGREFQDVNAIAESRRNSGAPSVTLPFAGQVGARQNSVLESGEALSLARQYHSDSVTVIDQ